MSLPKYEIRPNPSYSPIYKLSRPKHCVEISEGVFAGLIFSFDKIQIEEGNINFTYNLLYIPDNIELDTQTEAFVGEILTDIIQRGNYEFNTE
jgi:hypothetical protein